MVKKNKGLLSGMASGVLWGLDTALTGIILSSSPFIQTKEAIMLAPFISVFLHDTFSSLWMFLHIVGTNQLNQVIDVLKTKSGKCICIAALLGGPIGMTSYLLAIKYIGVGATASISAIYPAVGVFWAYLFLKEKLSKRAFIGLTISILAIILLGYCPYKIRDNSYIIGLFLALVCVVGWSLESVICACGMKNNEITAVQALQIRQCVSALFYGVIIIPIIGGIELSYQVGSSNLAILIGFTALIGTTSYIFYYKSIDYIGPVKATGLNITYSIWAIIFDVIILGNEVTLKLILCSIFIMIGTIMVSKN